MDHKEILQGIQNSSSFQRRIVISLLLLFDGWLGLRHDFGLISFLPQMTGEYLQLNDLYWMAQCTELLGAGMVLIHTVSKGIDGKFGTFFRLSSPLLIIGLFALCIESLMLGMGEQAIISINIANHGFTGLVWGATYLAIAAGLTLTYKVQRYGNFAQSEYLVFGAYIALSMMWSDHFWPQVDAPKDEVLNWNLLLWASLAGFLLTGLLGALMDLVVMRRFRSKGASPQVMMIASLGVAMMLRAALYLRYGSSTELFVPDKDWRLSTSKWEIDTVVHKFTFGVRDSIPFHEEAEKVFGLAWYKAALIIGVFASVLALLMLMNGTRLGRKMRAVADNPDLAAASGINIERVHFTSSFLSAGLSGFGGVLFAMTTRMNPEVGLTILLPAFAVIVLGTIGSVRGAIFAALIVGFVRSLSQPVLVGLGRPLDRPTISGMDEIMPYFFLIAVLMLLPKGIGDAAEKWRIERLRARVDSGKPPLSDKLPFDIHRFKEILKRPIRVIEGVVDLVLIPIQQAMTRINPVITNLQFKVKSTYSTLGEKITPAYEKLNFSKEDSLPTPQGTLFLCFLLLGSGMILTKSWLWGLLLAGPIIWFGVVKVDSPWRLKIPRGREQAAGSWITFVLLIAIMLSLAWSIPSVSNHSKWMGMARLVALLGIFTILSFSLNLHTGYSGMTNFGVIFFASIGAITVGLMSAGYGWYWWQGLLLVVPIALVIGWLLAYPTANLRMDYFAIVTISLGEIVRIALASEPLLRAGTNTSAIGISRYELPFEPWWDSTGSEWFGEALNLGKEAPYQIVIGLFSLFCLLLVWGVLSLMLRAPWGRILRAIREDEEVTQHHGHNVFRMKAGSLAIGAVIAALGGALWAWLNAGIFPDFMSPVNSTFLIWAAFIVGGKASNKGMVAGAFLVVLMNMLFTAFSTAQNDTEHGLYFVVEWLNSSLDWVIRDFIPDMFASDRAIGESFVKSEIKATLSYVKLLMIGFIIVITLHLAPKGMLPEVPYRPEPISEGSDDDE
ncbi:MAG: ABC transporter permease [Candidatus Poseidoniaceae archaeon]|nr:ABC transporter permease [Candidatus Poseidoniaceae archaeon]